MKVLHINILDKKATYMSRDGDIVCGNSDYVIEFAFDAEWNAFEEKIARFVWNNQYQEVAFTGTTCPAPIITNTTSIEVGVYAGELSTTTPAIIKCLPSILCASANPSNGTTVSSNLYIRYSAHEDGTDYTEQWSLGQRYIGFASGRSVPTDKSDYTWALFADAYIVHELHIRYSAYDDGTDFTDTWSPGQNYIGFSSEYIAPTNKEDYVWSQFSSNVRDIVRLTLKADEWVDNKQTIACSTILDKSAVWPSYAPGYKNEYIDCGISVDGASAGSVTYQCVNIPTTDIDVLLSVSDPLIAVGPPQISDVQTPTSGKYVMRDDDGNLLAVSPTDLRYPKLVFTYTHTTNKEVHVTDVDLTTGVFTSPEHGISNSQTVFVSVHYPYNIGTPLAYLPTGLILGDTGNTSTSKMYYVNKIDADHFAVRTTSTGEDVTFTENPTMDLSKFHFEFLGRTDLNIEGLDLRECLLVFKGKIRNNIRWVRPTNTILFGDGGNRVGAIAYDGAFGTDMYGSCYFGRPGYNHCYATAEFRMIDQNEVYQVIESSYVMYSETGTPTLKHNRQFFHLMLEGDKIDGITMYGDLMGGFFNGSTVEVYAK